MLKNRNIQFALLVLAVTLFGLLMFTQHDPKAVDNPAPVLASEEAAY